MKKRNGQPKRRSAAAVAAANAALLDGARTDEAAAPNNDAERDLFAFVRTSELPKTRRPPHMPKLPKKLVEAAEVYTGRGPAASFSQRQHLPSSSRNAHLDPLSALLRVPGDETSVGLGMHAAARATRQASVSDGDGADHNGIIMDWQPLVSRHRARRAAQHATWRNVVIPGLVEPFLAYLYENGQSSVVQRTCTCARHTWKLVLADWNGRSEAVVVYCDCQPVAQQLMRHGYFPCAPKRPSIAFSIPLLELISTHSLNVAPNSSAWADTLHMFWNRRTHSIQSSESLRKRLANALNWFQVLQNRAKERVDCVIAAARCPAPPTSTRAPEYGERKGSGKRKRHHQEHGHGVGPAEDAVERRDVKRHRSTDTDVTGQGKNAAHGGHTVGAKIRERRVEAAGSDDAQGTGGHWRGGEGPESDDEKSASVSVRAAEAAKSIDANGRERHGEGSNADDANGALRFTRHGEAAKTDDEKSASGSGRAAEAAKSIDANGRERRAKAEESDDANGALRFTRHGEAAKTVDVKLASGSGRAAEAAKSIDANGRERRAKAEESDDESNSPRFNQRAQTVESDDAQGMRGPGPDGEDVESITADDYERRGEGSNAVDEQATSGPGRPAESVKSGAANGTVESDRHRAAVPSHLLQQRCPLCFGGGRPILGQTRSHVIVCIDGNFAQKRRKSDGRDPEIDYIGSRFLSQEEVDAMEDEGKRGAVADEVLDECEKSFIAAQESITKASKNYYADTGLMAILCRHDRVLWVVNMTSAGEKQYYALALLKRLMVELPLDWNVGLLYDIGCQLSRSIEKFRFLEPFASRLSFAVSVFHAYGHQWICQLVYHPRKRSGFGLSDGEGCERFWSAIRRLIAVLRVCGFFRRLFLLDRQFDFIDGEGMKKFGKWLARRWRDCMRRLHQSEDILARCVHDEATLAAEWENQVASQLVKPSRQSKHAGDKEIDRILVDIGRSEELYESVKADEATLRKTAALLLPGDLESLTNRIDAGKRDVKALKARIKTATTALGSQSAARLQALRGDAYVCARVNARALRANIREAVRAHKFERERLERAYRRQVMQNKEHMQTRDLVHRRQTKISAMVRKYNGLVKKMEVLVKQGKAPSRRTRPPRRLDAKDLFKLNVDDAIWQEDPGLGPQNEDDLPRWQVDNDVRTGIPAMLEVRRCREEMERLEWEAKALQQWWRAEKEVLRGLTIDGVYGLAVQDRLAWLDSLAEMWSIDLAASGLSVAFGSAGQAAERSVPSAEPRVFGASGGLPSNALQPPALDAESDDDAESALMSVDDEDEPVADHLDEVADADELSSTLASDADEDTPKTVSSRQTTPVEPGTPTRAIRLPSSPGALSGIDISDGSASDDDAVVVGELARRCGPYWCDGGEVLRFVDRTTWVSGDGLAVLAEQMLQNADRTQVGVVPSTVFRDVKEYHVAKKAGDDERASAVLKDIAGKLQKVARVPDPGVARKWLVVVHVLRPQHWTLVEVHWEAQVLKMYDSFATRRGYPEKVEKRAWEFLSLCGKIYDRSFQRSDWKWQAEQRPTRQTNGFDCGPFVAADIEALLRSDSPSTKTQAQMRAWRAELARRLRSLPATHLSKAARRAQAREQLAEGAEVYDVDSS